jgi:hypothetical protein
MNAQFGQLRGGRALASRSSRKRKVDSLAVDVETTRCARTVGTAILATVALASVWQPPARADLELGIYEGVPWPIIEPPVRGPIALPPRPRELFPPATPASNRVLEILERVERTLTRTRYQHATVVREREGVFLWDCSGMSAWILARAAPRARSAIGRERPVARDFARVIDRAPTTRSERGWQRIEPISAVRPGDIFAWRRPRGFPSRNTGHVGFVVETPQAIPGFPGAYAVRIADSTSFGHQDDTRPDDGLGGFGMGTIVVLTDSEGRGTHYGWHGVRSAGYVTTPIVFGRVSR